MRGPLSMCVRTWCPLGRKNRLKSENSSDLLFVSELSGRVGGEPFVEIR